MKIDCLIPAAGFSSRMGQWKLVLPYKGSTIIERAVSNALAVCSRVVLVTGYRGVELENLFINEKRVVTVNNSSFQRGMFSSIQTGVPLLETDWFFITMGDMPEITPNTYNLLLNSVSKKTAVEIIRPLFKGKRGHPVLLKKSVIPTILKEPATSEMKNVFSHHTVQDLDPGIPETFRDIDTPEDYNLSLRRGKPKKRLAE